MKKLFIVFIMVFAILGCNSPVNSEKEHKWIVLGSPNFSESASDYLTLTLTKDGTPYVGYSSLDIDGGEASSMKFNGSSWVVAGSKGFSDGVTFYLSMASASDGTVYMAYRDESLSRAAVVSKYNGANWTSSGGNKGFSDGDIGPIDITVDENNIPYVIYRDDHNIIKKAKVKKTLNGINWIDVNSDNISPDEVNKVSIVTHKGTPYIAYTSSSSRLSIKKYDEPSWSIIGNDDITGDAVDSFDFAIADNGDLYLAYDNSDGMGVRLVNVMKYNGSSWVNVGQRGFAKSSLGTFGKVSLAIYQNTPYVLFPDEDFGGKTTVMKFNGNAWEAVGNRGFSLDKATESVMSISRSGIIIIAYSKDRVGSITSMMYE